MGIVTVDNVEHGSQRRTLLGKVVLGTPAKNHHINIISVTLNIIQAMHGYGSAQGADAARVTARENSHQLHIGGLRDGGFRPTPQVSIAGDCNAYLVCHVVRSVEKRMGGSAGSIAD